MAQQIVDGKVLGSSGVAKAGSYVLNSTKGVKERFGRLVLMHSNHRQEVESVHAGEIAAVIGLKNTTTGDTLCDEKLDVVLEKMEEESTTASGIILTSTKEKSKFAKVIAMGNDIKEAGYQTGDEVLYREYAGTTISYKDAEYIVIKDEDIIAVNQ